MIIGAILQHITMCLSIASIISKSILLKYHRCYVITQKMKTMRIYLLSNAFCRVINIDIYQQWIVATLIPDPDT